MLCTIFFIAMHTVIVFCTHSYDVSQQTQLEGGGWGLTFRYATSKFQTYFLLFFKWQMLREISATEYVLPIHKFITYWQSPIVIVQLYNSEITAHILVHELQDIMKLEWIQLSSVQNSNSKVFCRPLAYAYQYFRCVLYL